MQKYVINSFMLVVMLALINGCAVVAVGAVATAAGTTAAVATDPRSSGAVVDDNTIEAKLRFKYSATNYPDSNIYVTAYNGSVLLTGQVSTPQAKESAVFDAKVVPGVKQIYNYLQVSQTQSLTTKSQDSYTTTQIKAKILGLKDVSSNSIKVITTDDVVYLFGVLTKAQAKAVSDAAASVNGVTKVITLFEYVS